MDIAPTSLGLCGIDAPGWMVGTDYSGCYTASRPISEDLPDSAYPQLPDPGWVYGYASDRERPWRGVVTGEAGSAVLEGQPWLLYNLNEDPYETANLALGGRFRVERSRCQVQLAEWIFSTGYSFTLPDVTGRS